MTGGSHFILYHLFFFFRFEKIYIDVYNDISPDPSFLNNS